MKTQQRPFVVETKSSRRKSFAQPKSIWGDIDFNVLVREAEAETPHLFKPAGPAEVAKQVAELKEEMKPRDVESQSEDLSAVEHSLSPLMEENADSSTQPEQKIGAAAKPSDEVKIVRDGSVRGVDRQRKSRDGMQSSRLDGVPWIYEGDDDLILLGQENRRLKTLLRDNLILENERLRHMLQRFGSSST
jgi:hypothetical protein